MSNPFEIDVGPETPELLEFAKTALRETPENREKGLKELRELLKQNPDLNYRDDDEFLTIVLRVTHWYPDSALKMVRIRLSIF
jgi:retinaldehyde-binding protein 1